MSSLIEQIKHIIDNGEISQAKLAKEIGITSGALSSHLNGKYQGDVEKINTALESWLEQRNERQNRLMIAPDFIETETAAEVMKGMRYAHLLGTITTVYGASGVGKTTSAREYQRRNPNVWIITASPSRATLSETLYEMALELGINDAPKRKGTLSRLIVKKLTDTKGLFVIDEADHLPYDVLEEIRLIQEQCQIGFVLIGNDKVYNRMRGGAHQSHELARLWSRVAKHNSIKQCTENDVIAIADAWQLDSGNKKLIQMLNDICKHGGGLRILTQILRLAWVSAKSEGQLLDYDWIYRAKMELQGGAQ